MEEIIYFEINNWFSGRDYPNDKTFTNWVADRQFSKDEWCKENRLCVMTGAIDMSSNWCVAAPKKWVLENCPDILTDKEIKYATIITGWDKEQNKSVSRREEHVKKYSDFLCHPDEDGVVYGHISNWQFPEYCEENFGVEWNNSYWDDQDYDEDETNED